LIGKKVDGGCHFKSISRSSSGGSSESYLSGKVILPVLKWFPDYIALHPGYLAVRFNRKEVT